MDTTKRRQSTGENVKGGRNDFAKLLVAGGSLVVGSIGGVVLGRQYLKPSAGDAKQPDEEGQSQAEKATDDVLQQSNESAQHQPQAPSNTNADIQEPTPIDSHNSGNTTNVNGGNSQGQTDNTPDEVAQRIAGSTEVDAGDNVTASVMQIGSPSTMMDENGNVVNVFSVQFNDPNLAGQQFVLADTDGDGVFDGLFTADGQPFSLSFVNANGGETSFEAILANAKLEYGDLEEMSHSNGSYMARTEHDQDDTNDDPSEDIINTGSSESDNSLAMKEQGQPVGENGMETEIDPEGGSSDVDALVAQLKEIEDAEEDEQTLLDELKDVIIEEEKEEGEEEKERDDEDEEDDEGEESDDEDDSDSSDF